LYYDILAYCASEKKWLVIKNRYTPAFCQLIQGGYRNVDIQNLVLQLRWEEWQQFLKLSNRSFYFDRLYHSLFPFPSTDDIVYAKERFLANGPEFNKIEITKEMLEQNQEMWRFPSGVKKQGEEPQESAIRNFKICTQYAIQEHDILFLGKEPISEYKVSNAISTQREEHHYWIIVYNNGYPPLLKTTAMHPSPFYTKWMTTKEIEDENTKMLKSAKDIIKKANSLLKKKLVTYTS
jgi:ADP-ribose pyrophosphatase YjhB (NUDIX family)